MLFRKKIPRSCSYCQFATALENECLLCSKKGTVSQDHSCRKFRYDPCRRIPPKMKALDFSKYDQDDFSL